MTTFGGGGVLLAQPISENMHKAMTHDMMIWRFTGTFLSPRFGRAACHR